MGNKDSSIFSLDCLDEDGNKIFIGSLESKFNNTPNRTYKLYIKDSDQNKLYPDAKYPENKYGYCKSDGDLTIPYIFDFGGDFNNGIAIVKQGERWGMINCAGEFIIPNIYENIDEFIDNLSIAQLNGHWGAIHPDGSIAIPFVYSFFDRFCDGLALVQKKISPYTLYSVKDKNENFNCKNGDYKFGFINHANEVVIPFIYDDALSFSNGFSIVQQAGYHGCIDISGNQIIPIKFDKIEREYELFRVCKNNKYGYYNELGEEVTPLIYNYIEKLGDLYIVQQNENWGCISADFKILIPFIFDMITVCNGHHLIFSNSHKNRYSTFSSTRSIINLADTLIIASVDKRDLVYNCAGQEIMPLNEYKISQIGNGIFIQQQGKYKFIRMKSNKLETHIFDSVRQCYGAPYYYVKQGDKIGILDDSGNCLSLIIYDSIVYLKDYYFKAQRDGYFGFLNKEGKEISQFIYNSVSDVLYNSAVVNKQDEWFLIDFSGIESINYNIHPSYDNKSRFISFLPQRAIIIDTSDGKYEVIDTNPSHKELIPVSKNYKWGYCNENGILMIPLQYDDALEFDHNGYAPVKKNCKWGLIDSAGELIIPYSYHSIEMTSFGFLIAQVNPSFGIVTYTNQVILKFKYDEIKCLATGDQAGIGVLFKIRIKDKWGIIDQLDNYLLPLEYDEIEEYGLFDYNVCVVKKHDKNALMNHHFENITDFKYDTISFPYIIKINSKEKLTVLQVSMDKKIGFIDTLGKVIIPIEFENAYPHESIWFEAKINSKWMIIDIYGNTSDTDRDYNYNGYR